MAKITVSPTTYNITDANVNIVKIYFTTDVTLTDVKLSVDNGQNFLNNVSMTQTSAEFNISNLENKNYTCLLKGFYEESGGTETPTSYSITNNLTYCTSSNSATSVTKGGSFSTTITPRDGYKVNSITVYMGGTNITNTALNGNNINISNVTGNIVITANATQTTPTTYTITNNLTNCTTSNNAKSINANSKYSATITVNTGYVLSTFSVSMGGVDITNSVVNQNTITINSVTGNVIITVKAIEESTKPDIPDTPIVEDELEILPSCTYVDVAEGGSKTIYFKLSNKPASSTTINISSSSSNLTTSTTQLTFTTENYYIAQSVNITSVADDNETNDVYTLTISSTGLISKTITVDVIDSSNSNFEVIYDNGTLVDGASFSLSNAVNNGTYISTNQNQDVSVGISNHPLSLNKNDKLHVVLGLGTSEPSSIYSLRSLVLGDGSANNISNSNMINEVQINEALSSDGKVDTYWTIAGNLSNITLTFTCYFARVNIYKIYIERSE